MLTNEFVMGLLLASHAMKEAIQVKLFNKPLAMEYLLQPNRFNTLSTKYPSAYSVKVNNVIYYFNTIDFMQGFATAAMWFNVDHHPYWSNLIEFEYTKFQPIDPNKFESLTF